jgi:hypothetical protein
MVSAVPQPNALEPVLQRDPEVRGGGVPKKAMRGRMILQVGFACREQQAPPVEMPVRFQVRTKMFKARPSLRTDLLNLVLPNAKNVSGCEFHGHE